MGIDAKQHSGLSASTRQYVFGTMNSLNETATLGHTQDSPAIVIFQTVSLVVILIAGILGNGVIFIVFARKPSLLSISNLFILHLATCNFLMCVVAMPPVLVSVISASWILDQQSCVATGFLNSLLFVAIILTLVTITIDRYIAVMLPLRYYTYITRHRAVAMVLAVWAVALFLALPPVLGWDSFSYHPHRFICTTAVPGQANHGYNIFLMLGGFVAPLTSIVFMYSRMYAAARGLKARDPARWFRVPSSNEPSDSSEATKRPRTFTGSGIRKILRVHIGDEWRTAQTTLMVMLSFVISWLPYYMVGFVESASNRHVMSPFWEWIPLWMAFSSSALNPYVYVFRNTSMRRHTLSLIGVRRQSSLTRRNSKLITET